MYSRLNMTCSYGALALAGALSMYDHPSFNADIVNETRLDEIKALVESGDIKLKDYRDMFKRVTGDTPSLSNDELIFMIAGTDDELDEAEWVALMQSRSTGDDEDDRDESGPAPDVDQWADASMTRSAKDFAKNIEGSFMDTLLDIQEADEKTKRGIAIMLYNRKDWKPEVWDAIPSLDIDQKTAKEQRLNVLLPRWSYKDGNRNRVKDWFEIAITNTKKGAALVVEIDNINAAGGNEVKTPEQQVYARMDKKRRETLLATYETRLSNMVTKFKRMVRLKRTIDAINELQPSVIKAGLIPDYAEDGETEIGLTTTVECIYLQRWSANGKVLMNNESFMPNTFLRLSADDAKDKEALEKHNNIMWDSLMATKDREPTPGGAGFKVPTSPEKFLGAINSLSHYTEEGTNFEAFQKYYSKLSNDAEKLEVGESLEDMAQKIGQFYTFVKPTLEAIRKVQKELAANKNKTAPQQKVA